MTIQENVSLAQYTTLGVGGAARWFVETGDEEEILSAVRFARAQGVGCFILGGGSNLLVSDEGFDGVVVRVAGGGAALGGGGRRDGAALQQARGPSGTPVVRLAVEKNGAGVECLAGIPGSVGGTPVQNVGAYGQEVAQTIVRVRALDLAAEKGVDLTAAECGFGYRRSIFNTTERGRYAITRVEYRLAIGGKPLLEYRDVKNYFAERGVARPTLVETAAAVREIRARKGMLLVADDADSRSAGSFFKNPVVRGGGGGAAGCDCGLPGCRCAAVSGRLGIRGGGLRGEAVGGVADRVGGISEGICDGACGAVDEACAGDCEPRRSDGGGDCGAAGRGDRGRARADGGPAGAGAGAAGVCGG